MQPMAERLDPARYDRVHHFISDGLWDETPIEAELARTADRLVGGPDVLVIDDTSLTKQRPDSQDPDMQFTVDVAPLHTSKSLC